MIKMKAAANTILVENAWDLEVFKLAYASSLSIHKISKTFPKDEMFALTNQIRRASKSICANIAEGFAKQTLSSAEFRRFIAIALGSAVEMQVWIRYCFDLEYITNNQASEWKQSYTAISRMLGKLFANIA
jgi:four helix bundle protein